MVDAGRRQRPAAVDPAAVRVHLIRGEHGAATEFAGRCCGCAPPGAMSTGVLRWSCLVGSIELTSGSYAPGGLVALEAVCGEGGP